MTKDEMKNRISMALKDPILQQGFEIICKEIAELKKQQFSLRNERNTFLAQNEQYEEDLINFNKELAKAKEIIKRLLLAEEGNHFCDVHADREHIKARKEAVEFLRREG